MPENHSVLSSPQHKMDDENAALFRSFTMRSHGQETKKAAPIIR